MSTVYYCWYCDKPSDGEQTDKHYETGRVIYFCSSEHWEEYMLLKEM